MLGKAKYAGAVNDLLNLLKRPSAAKVEQAALQETICTALGAIGSPEAIPALSEIAESKSFLRIGTYPEKVRNAAIGALASIKRKQK